MPGAKARLSAILLAGLMAATATAGAEAGSSVTRHQDTWPRLEQGQSGYARKRPEYHREFRRERVMPFEMIVDRLAYEGYAEIRLVRRSGSTWYVTAVRNNGAVYKLKIDQRNGHIISRSRSGWSSVPVPGMNRRF